jgi:two-component system, sensor histidine kinase and response regulator
MPNRPLLTPEVLVPRLGDYLLEKGVVAPADLQRALDFQKNSSTNKLLGKILVDLNIIDQSTLDEAVTEQIIQLRGALQDANARLERRVQERTAELEQALRRLAEVNQFRANFVANLSHELRTPLTHLNGYLELFVAGDLGVLNEEQDQALQVILRSTNRLSRLIEDLIMFAVSERGQIYLKLQPVYLKNICNAVIARVKTRAETRKINLSLDLPFLDPQVEMDEEKITWVLEQLLDNAIKFTEPGGNVTLLTKLENDMVWFDVKDTGIGMPVNRIEEIFEPFLQLDGSSSRKYGGTGLGLALVRRIIEAHGTKIEVFSTIGIGSSFRFPLKLSPNKEV